MDERLSVPAETQLARVMGVPLVAHRDLVADGQDDAEIYLAGDVHSSDDSPGDGLGVFGLFRASSDGVPDGRREPRLFAIRVRVARVAVANVDGVAAEVTHPTQIGDDLGSTFPPTR